MLTSSLILFTRLSKWRDHSREWQKSPYQREYYHWFQWQRLPWNSSCSYLLCPSPDFLFFPSSPTIQSLQIYHSPLYILFVSILFGTLLFLVHPPLNGIIILWNNSYKTIWIQTLSYPSTSFYLLPLHSLLLPLLLLILLIFLPYPLLSLILPPSLSHWLVVSSSLLLIHVCQPLKLISSKLTNALFITYTNQICILNLSL